MGLPCGIDGSCFEFPSHCATSDQGPSLRPCARSRTTFAWRCWCQGLGGWLHSFLAMLRISLIVARLGFTCSGLCVRLVFCFCSCQPMLQPLHGNNLDFVFFDKSYHCSPATVLLASAWGLADCGNRERHESMGLPQPWSPSKRN